LVLHLFVLKPKLRRIIKMLILAAPAVTEVAALWLDAVGRGLQDAHELCAGESFLDFRNLGFDNFPDRNKRNEHDKVTGARNAFTTECDVSNC
jgi:hypothetical protein